MKTPNYKETQGKHPIPHAKNIAKDDNLQPESVTIKNETSEEEE
ncbi:hypothetical protein [Nonlabens ponticola]|nr:hypothetical protein [Nonlabens ponticola]